MTPQVIVAEPVTFFGETFGMARVGLGYAPLRAMCDAVGSDFSAQLKRIKNAPWGGKSVVAKMAMTAPDGKTYRTSMIARRVIAVWLSTLRPSQVAFEARVKLAAFREEFCAVTDEWFFGGTPETKLARMAEVDEKYRKEIDVLKFEAMASKSNLETALKMIRIEAGRTREFERKLASAMNTFALDGEVMTVADYHAQWPILDIVGRPIGCHLLPSVGRSIAAYSRRFGVPVRKVDRGDGRFVNAYAMGIIQSWRATQDEWTAEKRKEYMVPLRLSQLKLFAS